MTPVLLAWYLLVPPDDARYPKPPAPLSRWTRAGRFETAERCDERLDHELEHHNLRFVGAACIAGDDPRLETK